MKLDYVGRIEFPQEGYLLLQLDDLFAELVFRQGFNCYLLSLVELVRRQNHLAEVAHAKYLVRMQFVLEAYLSLCSLVDDRDQFERVE